MLPAAQRYAVIPTHNRPQELKRLVRSLRPHVSNIIIVDNASQPAVIPSDVASEITLPPQTTFVEVIYDGEQPPNLSRLWNIGLEAAEQHARVYNYTEWDVAVLNDDATIPPDWFSPVFNVLRERDVIAVSTPTVRPIHVTRVLHKVNEGGLLWRLCGWAFALRGESGIRADESMRWWYGDNDIDWTARTRGGTAIVPGPVVPNEHANSTTVGVLAEQAGRDRETFIAKWGVAPW